MSVVEQRYQAVLAVIADGLSVKVAAEKIGVSRQTLHAWLARYEAEGLDGLADRSHRPVWCPHQMPAEVEAVVWELRRVHRYWGLRRIVQEIRRRQLLMVEPSESALVMLKSTIAAMNVSRVPKRSASQPDAGISIATVSR